LPGLEPQQLLPHLVEQVREGQVQGSTNGRQKLGRDLLAAALELGQVRHRHPRRGRDLPQRASLGEPGAPQHLADQPT
jgi:hypothetical protein